METGTLIAIILMGVFTYATRLSFIAIFSSHKIPEGIRRALRFVPAAVFAAIILPALVSPNGIIDLSLQNTRILAGLAAALIAWRSKNVLVTIVAGMVILLILNLLMV